MKSDQSDETNIQNKLRNIIHPPDQYSNQQIHENLIEDDFVCGRYRTRGRVK